jgi:hypothetical protein
MAINEKTMAIRSRLRDFGPNPPWGAIGALAREFGVDPSWVSQQRAILLQSGEIGGEGLQIALTANIKARLVLLACHRGETTDRLAEKILACVVGADDKTCILDAVLDENSEGEA